MGRIVNMASVAGTLGGFGQASYSTTKAGILGLTRTLAMEGGRHGITCNAIVPGIIGSEAFHMANPAMNERIANRTVFKRPGEPQDIANAIAFLCSDLAGYVTGIELNVSGGVELFVFERVTLPGTCSERCPTSNTSCRPVDQRRRLRTVSDSSRTPAVRPADSTPRSDRCPTQSDTSCSSDPPLGLRHPRGVC